jgi:hypothetical protein
VESGGNPALFPREFYPELFALTRRRGGGAVIPAHPDRLVLVEAADPRELRMWIPSTICKKRPDTVRASFLFLRRQPEHLFHVLPLGVALVDLLPADVIVGT